MINNNRQLTLSSLMSQAQFILVQQPPLTVLPAATPEGSAIVTVVVPAAPLLQVTEPERAWSSLDRSSSSALSTW